MTTTIARRRGPLALVVTDIVDLLTSQPPQALMSAASIAIVAGEAAFMVPLPANIALAVGAEWAYLRGIASSPKGARGWTRTLNWGALALVVLYGLLWGARKFGEDPAQTFGAWGLTAIHILPVAFVSFAAAMVHRSAVEVEASEAAVKEAEERERERRRQVEDDERERRRQAAQDEAERRRLDALVEVETEKAKALARLEYRSQRAAANTASAGPSAASGTAANSDRDALREQVIRTLSEQPKANRSQLARDLGIGRTTVYEIIKEAQQRGELPTQEHSHG